MDDLDDKKVIDIETKIADSKEIMQRAKRLVAEFLPADPSPTTSAPRDIVYTENFRDYPSQLREEEGQINVYHLKKLTIAANLEALNQAIESFTCSRDPETGSVVSSLSNTMLKLLQDLQKSQNPQDLVERVESEVLARFSTDVVQAISIEARWILQECRGLVATEKYSQFEDTIKMAIGRIAPQLKTSAENQHETLCTILGTKKGK